MTAHPKLIVTSYDFIHSIGRLGGTHHRQSGADAIRTAEEDRRPAGGQRANRQLSTSLAFDAEPRATDAMLRRLENNTAGRCSGPAGAGEVFI
jgi:hypothetical protein